MRRRFTSAGRVAAALSLSLSLSLILLGGLWSMGGCSAVRVEPNLDGPPDLSQPRGRDGGTTGPTCHGRFCQVPTCPKDTTTEIVGQLFAGNGVDPVPGAAVFVPVYDLPELPPTLGCDLCNQIPYSVASSPTDFDGSFHLSGVPAGPISIVARLGRFQRVISMDVVPCAKTSSPLIPAPTARASACRARIVSLRARTRCPASPWPAATTIRSSASSSASASTRSTCSTAAGPAIPPPSRRSCSSLATRSDCFCTTS